MTRTLLDELKEALGSTLAYNENAEVAPVALLWPDASGHFGEAVSELRESLPVLELGNWDGSGVRGPAYWLRCAIAGTVDAEVSRGIPIVYLPGMAREDLRAVEECPRELAPLAELQYRGEWFAHPNGRDWSIFGFLSNAERGLGLTISDDAATKEALLGAFDELLKLPMRQLETVYVNADFLYQLQNPDPVDSLLSWLDDPAGFRDRMDDERWNVFVQQCKANYDFDPSTDGEIVGGRRLGERQGVWQHVWQRFERNPERYRGVEERLRKGRPDQLFTSAPGSWPQDNESAESDLRAALAELDGAPAGVARDEIERLWDHHQERRGWVWAQLGQSPLVFALEQIHRLAQLTSSAPSGDVDKLADAYAKEGWKADSAFVSALATVPEREAREAVVVAAMAVYRPWLESHAVALQEAIGPMVNAGTYQPGPSASTAEGTVTVFVDGLRLDLAHRLADQLSGLDVQVDTALAALPTVTANSKAVLTPVPEGSLEPGDDLGPVRAGSGAKADINVLRSLMSDRDVQVLKRPETGDPSGCAWTESGEIDKRGHEFGIRMVDELDKELEQIVGRVRELLEAGWEQAHIVTDHGWLLVPGGLEKAELPAATAEVKKGRCARLKQGADVSVPTVPWHWDNNVRIALAPGITCFVQNQEYEHGGVSLQECVVPRLRIRARDRKTPTGGAAFTKIKWLGLMCRVAFEHVAPGSTVDIRAMPGEATTSLAEDAKETTGAGKQSLFVANEEHEGEKAFLVIVSPQGQIVAQREVIVGSNR